MTNFKTTKKGLNKMWNKNVLKGLCIAGGYLLTGCTNVSKNIAESAGTKNLDLNGYVMLGEVETANNQTATPEGKMLIGRLTYKSRKVAIPGDAKVPNTGNFRLTRTKSLFGTEEVLVEYDWTAESCDEAEKAKERIRELNEKTHELIPDDGTEETADAEEHAEDQMNP